MESLLQAVSAGDMMCRAQEAGGHCYGRQLSDASSLGDPTESMDVVAANGSACQSKPDDCQVVRFRRYIGGLG